MARVEGEGALTIRLRDGRVDDVQLRIFEAPRFFEALLRGRSIAEVPDITARICGICPVAYQMSACHALEALLGVTPARSHCGRCAGCSIAASGSRAMCCISPSCTLPISWATRVPSRWPRIGRNSPTAARCPATEEGRQRHRRSGRRPRDPSDQREAGRLLSFPRASRSSTPLAEQLKSVQEITRDLVRWTASLDFPPIRARLRIRGAAHTSRNIR